MLAEESRLGVEAETFHLIVDATDDGPASARTFVRDVLGSIDPLDDILLATSELVTNAIRHSNDHRPITVAVSQSDDRVRIQVTNHTDAFTISGISGGARGGWGLGIVAAVSDDWGVHHADGEVQAWFVVLSAEPDPGH